MRNNEYARRKYTLGEGANRRKKALAARPQNENHPAGYLGWTPVSSHVRESEHLLFSSLRFTSLRLLFSSRQCQHPNTRLFI